jgi:hypothetical protein
MLTQPVDMFTDNAAIFFREFPDEFLYPFFDSDLQG